MGNSNLSGIEGFFSDLDAEKSAPQGEPVQTRQKPTADKPRPDQPPQRQVNRKPPAKQSTPKPTRSAPVRLPTGRPPGTKDGEGPRRTKASLWLDADLLDEYRERVYVERVNLGELIERALRAYKQQNW